MAYDEGLAERIREVLAADPSVGPHISEQKMFGGLAFMVRGHPASQALRVAPGVKGREFPVDSLPFQTKLSHCLPSVLRAN